MNFGEAIYAVRKEKEMSQKTFSSMIGIDQSYLSLIENNKKRPSTKLIEEVSNKVNIPLPILLFYSISEDDVTEEKKELFRIIFPRIKEMLSALFDQERNEK